MGQFYEKLDAMAEQGKFLCVGLDPRPGQLPKGLPSEGGGPYDNYFEFLSGVIDSVKDVAAAVKPNKAFFERLNGELEGEGNELFDHIVEIARTANPELVIIGDSKRADIGSSNEAYSVAEFDVSRTDALTTNPYFGAISARPFTDRENKGVIALVRTSNEGTAMIQDTPVRIEDLRNQLLNPASDDGIRVYSAEELDRLKAAYNGDNIIPFFAAVASQIRSHWNYNNNCGVVAGATYPEELKIVRDIIGEDLPILIPGVGAQGGDAQTAAFNGVNSRGRGILVSESRSIMNASSGADFADAARERALRATAEIQSGIDMRLNA